MQPKPTILLAEDDNSLATLIKDSLVDEGYEVVHVADGASAIQTFEKSRIDLCLLDIMMPVTDGFETARRIRSLNKQVPVIFLSTKGQESDRLKGYDSGADDYIAKPFSMPELVRKISVFIRRSSRVANNDIEFFTLGRIRVMPGELKVITDADTVTVTQREMEILQYFNGHRNKVVKRDELLQTLWGKNDYFLGRSMDVFMSKIRKLLKADPDVVLETIHGIGYRLNTP